MTKYQARVEAGLIDSDYRGEIFVIISNNGTKEMNISSGDRIAQMLIVKDPTVTVEVSHDLSSTTRQSGKFGSTGTSHIVPSTLYDDTTAAAATGTAADDVMTSHHQVQLSHDPFNDVQSITFKTLGKHPTQGMVLEDCTDWDNRVLITTCIIVFPICVKRTEECAIF